MPAARWKNRALSYKCSVHSMLQTTSNDSAGKSAFSASVQRNSVLPATPFQRAALLAQKRCKGLIVIPVTLHPSARAR